MFTGELILIERRIGILADMVRISYLFKTDYLIMMGTVSAVGITAGINEDLAFALVGYPFQSLEIVVEVIVDNNDMVILFHLLTDQIGIGYALAGGACELVIRIVFADVILQYG